MEAELEKFRRQKLNEKKKEERKEKLQAFVTRMGNAVKRAVLPLPEPEEDTDESDSEDTVVSNRKTKAAGVPQEIESEPTEENSSVKMLKYALTASKCLIWLLLFIGCVKVGWGAVYFIISSLFILYKNTRTGGRRRGEISAYSVFNENCESLVGTLKAEHLENQLLYRNKSD